MKRRSVIFDFDGTIVDTLPIAIECAEEVLGNLNLTDKKIEKYRNMTVLELIKDLKVPVYKIPKYAVIARSYIKKNRQQIKLFEGINTAIEKISNQGYELYIVSSNSVENIHYLLNKYNMSKYFKSIVGGVGVFGKTVALKGAIKRYKIDTADAVYIGDEVRDIKAAKKVGIPIISVTWGFNGQKVIKKNKPEGIVDKPAELANQVSVLVD